MDWAIWPLLLLSILAFEICKGCELELQTCTNAYEATMLEKNVGGPESSQAYCEVLRSYIQCTRKLSKACYTDITWRSYKPIQDRLHKTHCSGKNNGTHPRPKGPGRTTTPEPPATRPPIPCTYHGKSRFHYCGLFGDPHLRTFHDEYQTCQIGGAWPLIDNPYFAVQVTNERLQPRVPATAPTKITIIIRGSSSPCTTEKTYEAQSESAGLPATFTDDTSSSGPDGSVVLTASEVRPDHQRVEIYLRYIETTLVVRKVGRYLAFSARVPREITRISESNELCSRGCPAGERLNIVTDRGHLVSREEALERCRAASNELQTRLTDSYLDWCVFDVMTAGEAAGDFVIAAHSAQEDVLRFDPASLRNRTSLLENDISFSSASPLWRIHLAAGVLVLAVLYLV
ncbi:repulsive guidance molecule B [Bemisia tabaci]|uniref:repulsive guidance molecule B n=1 Tax=Bemisia tabaci TaxID=7038 RepID=UPI003B27C8EB